MGDSAILIANTEICEWRKIKCHYDFYIYGNQNTKENRNEFIENKQEWLPESGKEENRARRSRDTKLPFCKNKCSCKL